MDGLFVAQTFQGQIISYVFAGHWGFYHRWDIFKCMISRFDTLRYNDVDITTSMTFQYGPICIEKEYRGQGVINLIFEEMRVKLKSKYPIGLTFINKSNNTSRYAHTKKLGLSIIDEFEYNSNTYLPLVIDMQKSVL